MARITIDISDSLHDELMASGIPVTTVCRSALEEALQRMRIREHAGDELLGIIERLRTTLREDDAHRYERGFDLGKAWARETASLHEMEQVAFWAKHRWRQFHLDPATHSLPAEVCAANDLPAPVPGEAFWFEWDPYMAGIIDAVGTIHARVTEAL